MTRIDELLVDGVKASRRRKVRAESMLQELEFLESTNELRPRSYSSPFLKHSTSLQALMSFFHSHFDYPVPATVMSLFEKLKQVPKIGELTTLTQAPVSEKPAWEASHDGFLAWGTSKAIKETRKPGERDVRARLGRNAEAAADFLRQMDDAAMQDEEGHAKNDSPVGNGIKVEGGNSKDADGDIAMS